jgi:integrase
VASLTAEYSGRDGSERRKTGWVVQFTDAATGRRPKIRLGPVTRKVAENARRHIEHLLVAREMGTPIDVDTAQWLGRLEDVVHDRIVRAGLAQRRVGQSRGDSTVTVQWLVRRYLEVRGPNLKANTVRNLEQAGKKLVGHFGAERPIAGITKGEAIDWREGLLKDHAEASVATHVAKAKQFFAYARDHGFITTDPFANLRKGSQKNRKRLVFVTPEAVGKVLEVCPDNQWRLILVLARYGGLRVPSEMQDLKWSDVFWDKRKIRITVKKKEHLDGHEVRFIPIFPEIQPYLETAWEEAEDGAVYVVPRARPSGVNLGTQLRRFIGLAGLEVWPRVFQNLRASRDTELAKREPIHLVNSWMGHTSRVAQDHYQMVTDDDFLRVSQKPVQIPVRAGAIRSKEEHAGEKKEAVSPVFPNETAIQIPSTGIEPVTSSSGG